MMKGKPTRELMARVASLFAALGEETRLRILMRLREGDATVGELADDLGIAQPSASRHLAVLRQAGLISVRRDGNRAVCSASDRQIFDICELVCGCVVRARQRDWHSLGFRSGRPRRRAVVKT
jgi:DNA-binding transcriptional ArsR family regulator